MAAEFVFRVFFFFCWDGVACGLVSFLPGAVLAVGLLDLLEVEASGGALDGWCGREKEEVDFFSRRSLAMRSSIALGVASFLGMLVLGWLLGGGKMGGGERTLEHCGEFFEVDFGVVGGY